MRQEADVDEVLKMSDIVGRGFIVPINLPKTISAWCVTPPLCYACYSLDLKQSDVRKARPFLKVCTRLTAHCRQERSCPTQAPKFRSVNAGQHLTRLALQRVLSGRRDPCQLLLSNFVFVYYYITY